jgi:hypothetical protein
MTPWRWPLPNCVPWDAPQSGQRVLLKSGCLQAVHAPISGTAHHVYMGWEDPDSVAIENEEGILLLDGAKPLDDLQDGAQVQAGMPVGTSGGELWLYLIPKGTDPSLWRYYSGGPLDRLPKLLDVGTPLREAWARVTNRFHRDQEKLPTTPAEVKNLLCWLQSHPFWRVGLDDAPHSWMEPSLHPDIAWVDPTCEYIVGSCNRDDPRNTDFRVWLEPGRWFDQSEDEHCKEFAPREGWNDFNKWGWGASLCLECGGKDMQEALVHLALRMKHYYGDGHEPRTDIPGGWGCMTDKDTECEDAGDGFCKHCGYLVHYEMTDEELK